MTEPGDEVARLRERVAELERELADQAARANAVMAAAQRRTYWLDRYRIDLDALMERPTARAALVALRAGREGARRVRGAARALKA
ncbi:MAG: hypothetical protein M3P39_02440 [Actinomycetota bacterium]|nr:hypothetical protein [Actinomycetota bacterium]